MTAENASDRRALDDIRDLVIARLKRDLADPELPPDEFRKHAAILDDLYDHVEAAEKLALESRRLELDERKNETALRVAEIRAAALRRKPAPESNRPGRSSADTAADAESEIAPWGRKPDGSPYSHEEFCDLLGQAVADIYGFDLKTGAAVATENSASNPPVAARSP